MKSIDGKVVVGSIRSAIRYEEAPSMCVDCWLSCPQPIMPSTLIRSIRLVCSPKTLCYVCEGVGQCYPVVEEKTMKAYQFLEKYKFCKGTLARDSKGFPCSIFGGSSVSFCIIGSIASCYYPEDAKLALYKVYLHLLKKLNLPLKKHIQQDIETWNDLPSRRKKDVVALLRKLDI